MSYPIFIISLKSAPERRLFMIKQFQELSLPFEIFDAIDGRLGEHYLFEKYNHKKRFLQKGNALKKGELGCFASHYLLWQKCLELNKPIIIIEDDAVIYKEFKYFYKNITNIAQQSEYLRLFVNTGNHPYVKIGNNNGFDIVRYLKGPRATRGYFIKPSAAKKFIDKAQEWVWPVDDYMDMSWLNRVQCRGLVPGVVQGDGAGFQSTIAEHGNKERKKLKTKIIREAYNIRNKAMDIYYNKVTVRQDEVNK